MIESNTVGTSRLEPLTQTNRTSPVYEVGEYRFTWWGAIIAGALAAMSAQVIFALMGSTIGLSVVSATNDTPERGLSIGAGIWWLLTGLISLFFGGWIAGRLCRVSTPFLAGMHGFLAWCVVTVFSASLVAITSSAAAGGSYAVFGNSMSPRSTWNDNRTTSQQLMSNARSDAQGNNVQSQNANSATDTPEAKEAAKRAAIASGWTLVALVLGATVACLGGRAGVNALGRDTSPQLMSANP